MRPAVRYALWLSAALFPLISHCGETKQQTLSWPPVSGMPANVSVQQTKDPLWFAQDCLGALAQSRYEPIPALTRAKADADGLLRTMVRDSKGRRGWPYIQEMTAAAAKCGKAGSIDAFGDGSCNPEDTAYMIQTGYAVACLARLAAKTGDTNYLDVAVAVAADSWGIGVENSTCPGSFDYWYSYHANDYGRFVLNTSAIMGQGLVWLYEATRDAKYRDRALAIARGQHCEIELGNFGYFGAADLRYRSAPGRESRRIENHVPHQVKFLQLVGEKLNQPAAQRDAKTLLDAFLTCSEPHCRPNNCAAWAVPAECRASQNIAPCMDAGDDRWRGACSAARARFPTMTGFQAYLIEPATEK